MAVYSISNFDVTRIPEGSVFVLDTNVLFFLHSGYFSSNPSAADYSNFVLKLLVEKCNIIVSTFSIQELFHIIEKKEHQKYCDKNSIKMHIKDYRKLSSERLNIKNILSVMMSEIKINYAIKNGSVDITNINSFIQSYDVHTCDPIDYILSQNFDLNTTFFVSDDKDFKTITGINLITA